jgi:hypothetical protein
MASELPPDVVASLQQLLQGLAATDNAIRSSAEEVLNNDWIATKPDMLLSGLAEQIRNSTVSGITTDAFLCVLGYRDICNSHAERRGTPR